jgi:hypothetical protein
MKLVVVVLISSAVVAIAAGCSSKAGNSVTADADASVVNAANYSCRIESGRQQADVLPAEGTIEFKYSVDGNKAELLDLIGFVSTNYVFNLESNGTDKKIANYTGVFSGDFKNYEAYQPSVYTNHFKFNDFNAKLTSRHDGGGMWGYLVVKKDNTSDKIDAHYVFQAGDHIGGTIDMKCSKK